MGKSKDKASSGAKDKASKPAKPVKATVEARLLAELPALTAAEKRVFLAQHPPSRCDAMGGRTKSEGVLKEARAHAAVIAKALRKHPVELRRYGRARFAWLLTCVAALDDARDAQQATDGSTTAAKDRAARAEATARALREDLLDALTTIAEGNPDDERALATATGSLMGAPALVASLRGLSALARAWLDRDTEDAKVLAASVSLTLADVEAAEAAAGALEEAAGDSTIEGRAAVKDTPSVNRAEGRVLLELRLAMRAFERAHERNKEIPRLPSGAATRQAFDRRSAAKAGAAEQPAPMVEPAAQPSTESG